MLLPVTWLHRGNSLVSKLIAKIHSHCINKHSNFELTYYQERGQEQQQRNEAVHVSKLNIDNKTEWALQSFPRPVCYYNLNICCVIFTPCRPAQWLNNHDTPPIFSNYMYLCMRHVRELNQFLRLSKCSWRLFSSKQHSPESLILNTKSSINKRSVRISEYTCIIKWSLIIIIANKVIKHSSKTIHHSLFPQYRSMSTTVGKVAAFTANALKRVEFSPLK